MQQQASLYANLAFTMEIIYAAYAVSLTVYSSTTVKASCPITYDNLYAVTVWTIPVRFHGDGEINHAAKDTHPC